VGLAIAVLGAAVAGAGTALGLSSFKSAPFGVARPTSHPVAEFKMLAYVEVLRNSAGTLPSTRPGSTSCCSPFNCLSSCSPCNCLSGARAGRPGALPHVDKVAAHDWFNLIAISLLNLFNFYYLYTGQLFHSFWVATSLYFL
jgi:hypothetical protein